MSVPRGLPLAFALLVAGCTTDPAPTDAAVTDAAVTDAADVAPARDVAPADAGIFRERYPLGARFPEGGTYDPTDRAFYVGSLGDGTVRRVDAATGAETVVFTESAPGHWWTLGMHVDDARRLLWVCAMDDRSPMPRAGSIWLFDLTTGLRVSNRPLAAAHADATCTDVTVAGDGTAYVVDREQPNVYRLDLTHDATMFVTDPLLAAGVVGQNAVVVLPDQSALLSLVYLPSSLVRIGLADRSVRRVELTGPFRDPTLLAGADGMAYADGSAWIAFTSKVVRVRPASAAWAAATTTITDVPSGATDLVSTPGGLYLLNGQSVRFALMTPPDPFALVRFTEPL
ncbi:MAG: Superoxide dismutase [Myxococcaceae bacterium]|nr:Superoxide dismutase [Myxococcaceae bacterium]